MIPLDTLDALIDQAMSIWDRVRGDRPDAGKSIRLVAFDVDGVLTDGGIYPATSAASGSVKRYEIRDGLGIAMLQLVGIPVAIITGRISGERAASRGVGCR
jgi:3-deoxy-D-manno-octulosonate 8-phosphate phosphatase KdsC-like HAD superfamily phosphatase